MTRRIIAIMFCGTFLLLLIMAAFVYPLFNEWAEHLFKCAIVLKNPIIAVIIFYFGSYGISYLIKTKKDK